MHDQSLTRYIGLYPGEFFDSIFNQKIVAVLGVVSAKPTMMSV
jgi:hypothetical protein